MKNVLMAMMVTVMAGGAYAAGFGDLQALNTSGVKVAPVSEAVKVAAPSKNVPFKMTCTIAAFNQQCNNVFVDGIVITEKHSKMQKVKTAGGNLFYIINDLTINNSAWDAGYYGIAAYFDNTGKVEASEVIGANLPWLAVTFKVNEGKFQGLTADAMLFCEFVK